MSNLIAADIEQMRTTAAAMRRAGQAMRDHSQHAHQAIETLRGRPWSGRHRQVIEERWEAIAPQLDPTITTLEELAARIEHVASALEQAGAQFGDGAETIPWQEVAELGLLGLLLNAAGNIDRDKLMSFVKIDKAILDGISEFVEHRTSYRNTFLAAGRIINAIRGQDGAVRKAADLFQFITEQIPYRGSVDKFLKTKSFAAMMIMVDAAIGSYEDGRNGKYNGDWTKIIGVNAIDAGVNAAIAATAVGGAVLLANSVIQVGATEQVAIQRTTADWLATSSQTQQILENDANQVEGTIDRMNLGNVTKRFSETLYDTSIAPKIDAGKEVYHAFERIVKDPSYDNIVDVSRSLNEYNRNHMEAYVAEPVSALLLSDKGRQGLYETGKEAVKVLNGAADYAAHSQASFGNMELALQDKVIDILPVPDTIKQSTHAQIYAYMQQNEHRAGQTVKIVDDATTQILKLSDSVVAKTGDVANQAKDRLQDLFRF